MPTIVTLPQAPNTGLGTLGQVLLAGASEYAQNRRQDEREGRQRADRLADIADDRRYEGAVYERNRGHRLSDVKEQRTYNEQLMEREARLGFAREMVRTGYLAPGAMKDDAAIEAAAQRFAQDGLAQRYLEAIRSGDLSYADLGDAQKVAAGLAKFSQRLSTRTQFQEALPEQARERANQLVGEREQLARRASELESRLSEPEPQPTPQEVASRALQLAQAMKKPGEMPSAQEIAAMQGQAVQEIAAQKAMSWNQQRQDALVQRSLINDRLRDVSAELNTLTNRFGVVGVGQNAPAAAVPTAATATPKPDLGAAQQNFAAAITAELDKRRPKPAAAAPKPVAGPAANTPATVNAGQPTAQIPPVSRLADVGDAIGSAFLSAGRVLESSSYKPRTSWTDPFEYVGATPERLLQEYRQRLGQIGDKTNPRAVWLSGEIQRLEQALAQKKTKSAQMMTQPAGSATETAPRTVDFEWWNEP